MKRQNGSREDASELLQDCLVALYHNVSKPGFTLTAKLDTYLFAIARNLWLKRLRTMRKEVALVDWQAGMDVAGAESPDSLWTEEPQPMQRLLSQISPRCRELLTMIFVDELGIKEIKEMLGYGSEQAVRNKKSECLGWLRNSKLGLDQNAKR